MPRSTRRRSFTKRSGEIHFSEDSGQTWNSVPSKQLPNMGSQVTDSEGHKQIRPGLFESGGPFYTAKVERSFPTVSISGTSQTNPAYRIKGKIGTPMPDTTVPIEYRGVTPEGFRSKDLSDLDPLGATAISSCAPTNPNSSLAVALGEVRRDGIPALPGISTWRKRTAIAKAAGSEYLNYVFGWLPLVSEVDDVASSTRNSRDILKQYQRDSGRNVRREFEFPIEKSEYTTELGDYWPAASSQNQQTFLFPWSSAFGPIPLTQSVKIQTRRWFSGAFTHTLPDRGDAWSGVFRAGSEADKLYGITPTPDVLWELTPWSWAIDWFSNTGDVINNASQFAIQGLVMRYGYIMEEKSVKITNQFGSKIVSPFLNSASIPPSTIELISKTRAAANPFGFGLTWDGLSSTQVAIAAALGITRS